MLASPEIKPDCYVWNFDGRPRSLEFVQRIPFVNAAGYHTTTDKALLRSHEFKALFASGLHDVIKDWQGFDYTVCFNGSLTVGRPFSSIIPNINPDWQYPILETPAETAAKAEYRQKLGSRYLVLYFSNHGMFQHWMRRCSPAMLRQFILNLRTRLPEHKLVLTGSTWDGPLNKLLSLPGTVNLVGQTDTDRFFGLLKGAACFCGFPGGNTILSTHFGVPTVMIWDQFFKYPGFRTNWVDPVKVNRIYFPLEASKVSPATLTALITRVMRK